MQVLELCFKLYESKESSVRNTAGVAIRQIVSSLFERLDSLVEDEGVGGAVGGATSQLPTQASDAYLLFQVRFDIWVANVHNMQMLLTIYCHS